MYLEAFQKALSNRDASALLRLWEEYTSSDEIEAEEFKAILQNIKDSDLSDYVGRHVERAIPLWQKLGDTSIAGDVLQIIVDLQVMGNQQVRQLAIDFLDQKFGNDPQHQEKMRLIGLRGKSEDFKGCISNYILLNHMKKGNFVFHKIGWGVGEIMDVSMLREELKLEFDYAPGLKDLPFRTCFQALIPIPSDHFLALRFGSPDKLEERAKDNPLEVLQMLLRDLGPKTAAEIKDELCELVIPEEEWNRWWQNARTKLKKDTKIENPSDLRHPFKLLLKEVSHEEKLRKALETKPDANTLIQMVFSFLKDFPETLKNLDFKNGLKAKLNEMLSFSEIKASQALQIHFFLQDLNAEKQSPVIVDLIKKTPSIEDLLKEITIQSFKKRTLSEAHKNRDDWKEIFAKALFTIEQNTLKDYILAELLSAKAEELLKKRLKELYENPAVSPDTLIWYFQKVIAEPSLPYGNAAGHSRFMEAFLILLSHVEQTGQRDLVKKMHEILSDGRYAIVRQIMKSSNEKEVQEFLLLITKCHSFSDHDIKLFYSLAEVAHPSLTKKSKKHEPIKEEEDIIWTTHEGYIQLQKRIEQIGTVETVENAKEIEVARAHGDLRENAEFKAALERRDRLQAELKFLSDQLNKCRIITKADVHTDKVSVGVTVECKNKEGDKLYYTLLGPWDADPEKNILSFQSKIAKSLEGLKVGDSFDIQGKKLQITGIKSAL